MTKDKPGFLRRTQYLTEYAAIRVLSAVTGLMPEQMAAWAGRNLGRLLWLIAPRRRLIARGNIERAMPHLNGQALDRMVKEAFLNIGLTAMETLWMRRRVNPDDIARRFPMDGIEAVDGARRSDRGVIVFTLHLGNWELCGATVAAQIGGVRALARPVNNPHVRAYTTRLRERLGMTVLSTRDGVRPMLRALRAGGVLAVLMDQHVNRAFVPATFFARPAATTAVVASLALRTGAPVFAGYGVRQGRGFRHHGQLEGPLELIQTGDHEADVAANTQRFNDRLEQFVRKHPEQWLWTHRRWKLADRAATAGHKEK